MLPSLFVAHGAPTLAVETNLYTKFLTMLAYQLPKPKAIVLVSAHWESSVQLISGVETYEMIYDFYGFPETLYELKYPAAGEPRIAQEIKNYFMEEGIACQVDVERGLDHGAWVILHLMYPTANIPVVALSVNPRLTPEEQYRTGRAIQALRAQDILIMGSGGTVHNLTKLEWTHPHPKNWAVEFELWLGEQIETWHLDALFNYEARAPHAREAVPTFEHFAPLLVSMGAADRGRKARLLHRTYQYGTLSMSCWMFG